MKETRVSDPTQWESSSIRSLQVPFGVLASELGEPESALVEAPPNDHSSDRTVGPLLIHAALSGDLQEVRRLVSLGADVNFTNRYGVSALMVACLWDRQDIVRLLLEEGADTDAVEYAAGSDALLYACLSGNPCIVRLVLDAGATVDTRNRFGRTPLMVAATVGDVEAVRLLMDRGADLNAVDNSGSNALQIAMDQGFEEVAAILKSGGACQPFSLCSDLSSTAGKQAAQLAEELLHTGGYSGLKAPD